MVLVEDVTDDSNSSPNRSANSNPPPRPTTGQTPPRPSASSPSLINLLSERKMDAILLLSRLVTIIFTIMYILPIFRSNSESMSFYSKALLASAVTSALRLQQRLPPLQLSREFFNTLIREDSAHYLMYSILFLSGSPMTIVLIPITTYAILHSCSFLSQILTNYPRMKFYLDRITENHANLLRFVALNEIILMPLLILSIFFARANFILIFMYYRFLALRYTSHRNPYTRTLFFELRQAAEHLCTRPACPSIVGRMCHGAIALVNRLAPVNA